MNLPRLDKYITINFLLYINIFLFIINIFIHIMNAQGFWAFNNNAISYKLHCIALWITIITVSTIPIEFIYRRIKNIKSFDIKPSYLFLLYLFSNFLYLDRYIRGIDYYGYFLQSHFFDIDLPSAIILVYLYIPRNLPKLNKNISTNTFIYSTLFGTVLFLYGLFVLAMTPKDSCGFYFSLDLIAVNFVTFTISLIAILLLPVESLLRKKNMLKTFNKVNISYKKQTIILITSIIFFMSIVIFYIYEIIYTLNYFATVD